MPRPTSATTLQRPDLGALMYEYFLGLDRQGFVGRLLLPIFGVPDKSADYPIIPTEAILKVPDKGGARAPRAAYDRDDFDFATGTYACKEYGIEAPVDEVEARMYRRYFDAEEVASMRATLTLARLYEIRVKTLLLNTSNFSNAAVSVAWSTAGSAVPGADINGARTAIRNASGLDPNVVVMSRPVFDNLVVTTEIKDAFKYTNPVESMSRETKRGLMAQYFQVDEVLVAGGMYDSTKKGQATTLANIWGTGTIGVFRIADSESQDLREPVVGRTFLWEEDSPELFVTEQYEEPQTRSQVYRVRQHTDERLVYAAAGYLLTGASG